MGWCEAVKNAKLPDTSVEHGILQEEGDENSKRTDLV